MSYSKQYPEAMKKIAQWIKSGELKYKEDIVTGVENASLGLQRLLTGKNTGKVMVHIPKEELPKI